MDARKEAGTGEEEGGGIEKWGVVQNRERGRGSSMVSSSSLISPMAGGEGKERGRGDFLHSQPLEPH